MAGGEFEQSSGMLHLTHSSPRERHIDRYGPQSLPPLKRSRPARGCWPAIPFPGASSIIAPAVEPQPFVWRHPGCAYSGLSEHPRNGRAPIQPVSSAKLLIVWQATRPSSIHSSCAQSTLPNANGARVGGIIDPAARQLAEHAHLHCLVRRPDGLVLSWSIPSS